MEIKSSIVLLIAFSGKSKSSNYAEAAPDNPDLFSLLSVKKFKRFLSLYN